MECAACGLAPCDLPLGVDPDLVFERDEADGEIRCHGCLGLGATTVEV